MDAARCPAGPHPLGLYGRLAFLSSFGVDQKAPVRARHMPSPFLTPCVYSGNIYQAVTWFSIIGEEHVLFGLGMDKNTLGSSWNMAET